MNPTDIVFATEESRIKAREQYLLIHDALRYSVESGGQAFDRRFPPIAPPKMVPFEGWATVASADGETCVTGEREPGNWMGAYAIYKHRPEVASGVAHLRRIARVRVEEIPE